MNIENINIRNTKNNINENKSTNQDTNIILENKITEINELSNNINTILEEEKEK